MSHRRHQVVPGVLIALAGACATAPPASLPQGQPALVVVIVVDQMRADVVEQLRPHWTAGFKRLLDEGAWFPNAAYPFSGTLTCAGHATIGTGTFPATHGIPDNTWYDREAGATVACAEDAEVRPVSYGGGGAGAGNSAHNLRAPTLAQELRAQQDARVATIALKARSAIMLAGPSGDAVTWLNEALDGWETSTAYTARPVPAVQTFVDANPIDLDHGRTWARRLPESAYSGPDDGAGEAPTGGWTTVFPHVLRGNGRADRRFHLQWERSPYADEYVGRFAASLVDALELGAGDRTDFLGVGFSTLDLAGHGFGPRSHEVQDILLHLDVTIGRLLDRLDEQVGRGRYVVALSSDHGVADLAEQLQPEGRGGGRLDGDRLVKVADDAAQKAAGPGRYVARVNSSNVYFEPGMYAKVAAAPGAIDAVLAALTAEPGIAGAFPADRIAGRLDAADPDERMAALSYVPERSGEILIVSDWGWTVPSGSAVTAHHGTGHDYDRRVPVILMGAGIKPGRYEDAATPADIAPTLAALAGIALPRADGRVLQAALAAPGVQP